MRHERTTSSGRRGRGKTRTPPGPPRSSAARYPHLGGALAANARLAPGAPGNPESEPRAPTPGDHSPIPCAPRSRPRSVVPLASRRSLKKALLMERQAPAWPSWRIAAARSARHRPRRPSPGARLTPGETNRPAMWVTRRAPAWHRGPTHPRGVGSGQPLRTAVIARRSPEVARRSPHPFELRDRDPF